jgi:hypothetical protein
MKCILTYIICLLIFSCKQKEIKKPIWVNNSKSVYTSADTFIFITNGKKWEANLVSFIQPLPITSKFSNDSLFIQLNPSKGVVEGLAQLCLQNGKATHVYHFYLQNESKSITKLKDYRSPKTVNPDSGLLQHRIKHVIDENRNIVSGENGSLFFEDKLQFSPIVKTYRAIANEPLTAHYVQAGSATSIPIVALYNENLKQYEIKVGVIYDANQNIIADGTNITFEYSNASTKGIANATTLNGIAKILLPFTKNSGYNLVAKIHQTKSVTIKL